LILMNCERLMDKGLKHLSGLISLKHLDLQSTLAA
jgi:hypothetical protein